MSSSRWTNALCSITANACIKHVRFKAIFWFQWELMVLCRSQTAPSPFQLQPFVAVASAIHTGHGSKLNILWKIVAEIWQQRRTVCFAPISFAPGTIPASQAVLGRSGVNWLWTLQDANLPPFKVNSWEYQTRQTCKNWSNVLSAGKNQAIQSACCQLGLS